MEGGPKSSESNRTLFAALGGAALAFVGLSAAYFGSRSDRNAADGPLVTVDNKSQPQDLGLVSVGENLRSLVDPAVEETLAVSPFERVQAALGLLLETEKRQDLNANQRAELRRDLIETRTEDSTDIVSSFVSWRASLTSTIPAEPNSSTIFKTTEEREVAEKVASHPDLYSLVLLSGRELQDSAQRQCAWEEMIALSLPYSQWFEDRPLDLDPGSRLPLGDVLVSLQTMLKLDLESCIADGDSINSLKPKLEQYWSILSSGALFFDPRLMQEIDGKGGLGVFEEKHYAPSCAKSFVSSLSGDSFGAALILLDIALRTPEIATFWKPTSLYQKRLEDLSDVFISSALNRVNRGESKEGVALAVENVFSATRVTQLPKSIYQELLDLGVRFELPAQQIKDRLNSSYQHETDMKERALCFQTLASHGLLELPEIEATLQHPGIELQIAAADAAGKFVLPRALADTGPHADGRLEKSEAAQLLLERAAGGEIEGVSTEARTVALFSLLGSGDRQHRLDFYEKLTRVTDSNQRDVTIGAIVSFAIEIEGHGDAKHTDMLYRSAIDQSVIPEVRTVALKGFLRSSQTRMFELLCDTPPVEKSRDAIEGYRKELAKGISSSDRRDRVITILELNSRIEELVTIESSNNSEIAPSPQFSNGLMLSDGLVRSLPESSELKNWRAQQVGISRDILNERLRSGFTERKLNLANYL